MNGASIPAPGHEDVWLQRWLDLLETEGRRRDALLKREGFLVWSLLAQDAPMTMFGKPFTVTFSWPEGLPLKLRDEAELRAYARRELAKLATP